MPFCTKCGQKNSDDNRFCEECGAPLKVATQGAPTPAVQPTAATQEPMVGAAAAYAPPPQRSGRGLLIAGVAVCALAIAGTGAYFALAAQAPSKELFAALIEQSVAADPSGYQSRYCMSNFAYDKDLVYINPGDYGTKNWMTVLTKAGLYGEPELETVQNGFFTQEHLRYTKTDAGKKATKGRTLCVADGVAVERVESFTPPTKKGELEYSVATVTFKLRNPMSWVGSDEAKQSGPNLPAEFQETKTLTLKEKKWVLATEADVRAAILATKNPKKETMDSGGGDGFFASLMKLFASSGGNPLIGRWKSNVMGFGMSFEFDAEHMTNQDGKTNVRYEVDGKTVTVYPVGSPVGLVFKTIDSDTMSLNMGLMDLELKRVK